MRLVIFLLFLAINFSSFSQRICSLSKTEENANLCVKNYVSYRDNINATEAVNNVLEKIKIKNTYFIVKVCRGINNAFAININEINYIILDVEWMEALKVGKNDWFHLFVISHEIAHHIFGHTSRSEFNNSIRRQNELICDEFAGFILAKYGATELDLNNLFSNLPEPPPESTHPRNNIRIYSVLKGFKSSNNKYENQLIRELTNGRSFKLSNFTELANNARSAYDMYINNNSAADLQVAISNYEQAIRFSEEPSLLKELANLYLVKGEIQKHYATLELSYSYTKDINYIITQLASIVVRHDFSSNYWESNIVRIKEAQLDKIYDVEVLVELSKIMMYLSTEEMGHLNETYLSKAQKSLLRSQMIINQEGLTPDKRNLMFEIENELVLHALRTENYLTAQTHIFKAFELFNDARKYDNLNLEEKMCYYSYNLLSLLSNLTLVCVRLRMWDDALVNAAKYDSTFFSLSNEKRKYLNSSFNVNANNVSYLKARAFHNTNQFHKAIEFYSKVISDPQADGNKYAYYYYRALSYFAINEQNLACSDLKVACDGKFNLACSKLQLSCKN